MSTTPKSPTSDLVAALAELDNVKANKVNPGFKNRYVSLDALLDAIKPILFSHNLALIQTLVSEEGKVGINTAFLHASGERFDFGRLMVKAEGLDAQKIGGAITYIRRQSIQTACGISVDLDAGRDAAHIFQCGFGGVLHSLKRIAEHAELHDEDVHAVVKRFNLGGFISRLDVIGKDL